MKIINKFSDPPHFFLLVSILLFLASLPFGSLCIAGDCSGLYGWTVFFFGWMESYFIFDINLFGAISWFANPALIIAWLCISASHKKCAGIASGIAIVLCASLLLAENIVVSQDGIPSAITGYAPGYWLWFGSTIVAGISATIAAFSKKI
ncbi:MAG: hypothetical protein ABI479_06205 [Gallionella sp.]